MKAGTPPELFDLLEAASTSILGRIEAPPQLGLILGSGLGGIADRLEDRQVIPYAEIPHFPVPAVEGHPGRLVIGSSNGVRVAAMQGRVHGYEGYLPWEVGFPARVLSSLGISALVVTNASGGIRSDLQAGDLMRIVDHVDLSGGNPLVGPNDERLGPRFPDMTRAYDPLRGERLDAVAERLGIELKRGIYASVRGPSFETPAEIRMLRGMGADAVGMSTVPEVVVAAHMGIPLVAVACISNAAAAAGGPPLSHEEVGIAAAQAADKFARLLEAFFPEAVRGEG